MAGDKQFKCPIAMAVGDILAESIVKLDKAIPAKYRQQIERFYQKLLAAHQGVWMAIMNMEVEEEEKA